MSASPHPAAVHHLPSFITAPGETDILMVAMAVFLVGGVLGLGVLFWRLHALPEHIAHKSNKLQYEIVCVLALISLLTHMHIFWIIGLFLALIDIPDFGNPLRRMAGSLEKIAGVSPEEAATRGGDKTLPQTTPTTRPVEMTDESVVGLAPVRTAATSDETGTRPREKERVHA